MNRRTAWPAIRNYGERAGLPLSAHPHMPRPACGFALADQGADTRLIQDYLGNQNIQHTVMYTVTNLARFGRLWRWERTVIDLEALKEILDQLAGDAGFERGRSYSAEITTGEVKRVLGEEPSSEATIGLYVKVSHTDDCQQHLSVVRQLRSLPGGKKESSS